MEHAIADRFKAIAAMSLVVACAAGAGAVEPIAGRAEVVDGITLQIRGERISLFGLREAKSGRTCRGITGQRASCAQEAARVLAARIGSGVVTCVRQGSGPRGREEAICRVYGEDLSAWMVGLGWALADREASARYVPAENLARSRGLGVWAGR